MDANRDSSARRRRLLLLDDDPIVLESLGNFLEQSGYDVVIAESVSRASQHLAGSVFDLLITDLMLPGADAMELLRRVRQEHPETFAIVITGYGTVESAVEAMKEGAFDYLTKPIIDEDLLMAVRRALRQRDLLAENRQLRRQLAGRSGSPEIVGQDFRMVKVFETVESVAPGRATVLITGESGTGKSMLARAIHAASDRASGPFVEVSCGALPETLLTSELFGHVRGAFTGAMEDRQGKFAAADGGTIFLDEIATASPQLQVQLLRLLQERTFEPVGSSEARTVNVRVVLATNRDLWEEVQAGTFREDLYYRVHVVEIELPPLRERVGDIPLLAEHFLDLASVAVGLRPRGFTSEAMAAMQRYAWPGNVRELANCIERAAIFARGGEITPSDLPPTVKSAAAGPLDPAGSAPVSLADAVAETERRAIAAALKACDNVRQAAADRLGINRVTLYKKMRKYGIEANE